MSTSARLGYSYVICDQGSSRFDPAGFQASLQEKGVVRIGKIHRPQAGLAVLGDAEYHLLGGLIGAIDPQVEVVLPGDASGQAPVGGTAAVYAIVKDNGGLIQPTAAPVILQAHHFVGAGGRRGLAQVQPRNGSVCAQAQVTAAPQRGYLAACRKKPETVVGVTDLQPQLARREAKAKPVRAAPGGAVQADHFAEKNIAGIAPKIKAALGVGSIDANVRIGKARVELVGRRGGPALPEGRPAKPDHQQRSQRDIQLAGGGANRSQGPLHTGRQDYQKIGHDRKE